MPSDSDDFSSLFTHLLHNSPSSSLLSKPKTSPPPPLFPPPLGTTVLGSDSPAKSDGAVSDHSFDFSDPYAYVKELFPSGLEDSDENTAFVNPLAQNEKNGESSQTKRVAARTSSKRSRAAEVHNMSEKRRRSRINEKMKALQNLIPNSNKTDKASMLDEAIEYLKQLQFQVQMLMVRNGLSLHPMCLPGSMTLPHQAEFNFDESNNNVYNNSSRGMASSSSFNNAECLVPPPDFNLPKHCSISDQPPMIIPSITNMSNNPDTSSGFRFHVAQFDPSTSSKNALSNGTPQLHLAAEKIEKSACSDVS